MVGGVGEALRALPLKEMDAALLSFAILRESAALGVDTASLAAAMEVAAYLHRDDYRSSRKDLPVDTYITHPFRIVLRLMRYGSGDSAVLCAAALHDTVEDHPEELVALLGGPESGPGAGQPEALDLLAAKFGPDVARIVAALTNPPFPPGGSQDEHHRIYWAHVAEILADPQACLVKLADFVDNAGGLRYLADDATRARLERRYSPLVPVFHAALDAHRASGAIDADVLDRIDEHFTEITARLDTPSPS